MSRSLLLVGDQKSPAVDSLERAFCEAGFETVLSPEGLYAVLWLERHRAAAAVIVAPISDMEPRELAEILSTETGERRVPCLALVLPAGESVDEGTERRFDLVSSLEGLPARLLETLRLRIPAQVTAGPHPGPELVLRGDLGLINFAHLVQVLGEAREPRVLRLTLKGSEALVFFDKGKVTHCLWGGLDGVRAFRDLLRAAGSSTAEFCVEAAPANGTGLEARPLGRPIAQLLLEAAEEADGDLSSKHSARQGVPSHA